MVLAAPAVLPHVPPARRGLAAGAVFTGVGLGIAASGTLVPLLLRAGVAETWCGLGAVSLLLTLLAWGGWPDQRAGDGAAPAAGAGGRRPPRSNPVLRALYVEYGLTAVGLVPHMVFLVDFVARGLGRGIDAGARYWVVFGLGAVVGPLLAGHLADRIGFRSALRLALLVQTVAVAAPAVAAGPGWLIASSAVVGASVPGIVALALGRAQELVGPHDVQAQSAAWGLATTAFALGQAAAAYGFAFLYARTGGYVPLFALGAGALAVALAIDLAAGAFGRRRGHHRA